MARSQDAISDRFDKREAILDAALELFTELGFHGTPIPLLAERANVGAGTIYRYFENKEALVNAVYQRAKTLLYETLVQDFPYHLPAREQFRVFWFRMINFSTEHPLTFQFLEFHHHVNYLDKRSLELDEKLWEPGVEFFEKSSQQQITKPLPLKLMVAIVWGIFVGVVKVGSQGHFALSPETISEVEQACWEAIRY